MHTRKSRGILACLPRRLYFQAQQKLDFYKFSKSALCIRQRLDFEVRKAEVQLWLTIFLSLQHTLTATGSVCGMWGAEMGEMKWNSQYFHDDHSLWGEIRSLNKCIWNTVQLRRCGDAQGIRGYSKPSLRCSILESSLKEIIPGNSLKRWRGFGIGGGKFKQLRLYLLEASFSWIRNRDPIYITGSLWALMF